MDKNFKNQPIDQIFDDSDMGNFRRPNEEKSMSFLDHVEELRWHLIRAFAAILICMTGLFFFVDDLIKYVVLAPLSPEFPTHKLLCSFRDSFCFSELKISFQSTSPTEQFTKAIMIAIVGGLIISFPYIVWELWRFIRPGLRINERKNTKGVVFIVSGLFLTGVLFTYFFILPFTFRFFATFTLDPRIQNIWRIGEVIGLVTQFCLAGGLLFEQPVLVYVLSRIGILNPTLMRKYRRHAIVITLMLGGILTPSPDVMSQILLSAPIIILYEVGVFISAWVYKQKMKEVEIIKVESQN